MTIPPVFLELFVLALGILILGGDRHGLERQRCRRVHREKRHELARDPQHRWTIGEHMQITRTQLARARCASPSAACSPATMAALDMHAEALGMLQRWGVQEPRRDTRTALAYRLAQRTARIASLGTPALSE